MKAKMMTDEQYKQLLIILAEECAEVIQECSKLIRFNNEDKSNLEKEIGDVVALLLLASINDVIDLNKVAKRVPEKMKKLKIYSDLLR